MLALFNTWPLKEKLVALTSALYPTSAAFLRGGLAANAVTLQKSASGTVFPESPAPSPSFAIEDSSKPQLPLKLRPAQRLFLPQLLGEVLLAPPSSNPGKRLNLLI